MERTSKVAKVAAWAVHLLTASGALWGLLAFLAIREADWKAALGWMGLAVLVDSVDGFAARRLDVASALPKVDGALLDNLIDYLNYAIVPAYFIYELRILPAGLDLAGAAMICMVSAFQFSHLDAKTDDHLFRGFPSYWNLVAFYLLLLRPAPWVALTVVAMLCTMVFVPVYYVHPSRTHRWRGLTLILTAVFALTLVVAVVRHPTTTRWPVYASLLYVVYYAALSFKLTAERRVARLVGR